MKKLALLLSLVLVFNLSLVFATEENPSVTSATPDASVEETVTETEVLSGELPAETLSGEDTEKSEVITEESGNTITDTTNTDATDTAETTTTTEETATQKSNNSSIIGAIIAVVIVVAVVAIAAILRKD